MRVFVNGADTDLPAGATVAGLVEQIAADRRRIAVACNGEVVPRSLWGDTALTDGDRIEVLAAVAGG
jgi:sulfur carrier protein